MTSNDTQPTTMPPEGITLTPEEWRAIQEHRAKQAAAQPQPQYQFALSAEDLERIVDGVMERVSTLIAPMHRKIVDGE